MTSAVVSSALSTMLPVVACSVTSPAVVPAFTTPTMMLPVAAVMLMSLASLSVVDVTEVAVAVPPVVTVIEPFAAVTLVSVAAPAERNSMLPAV